MVTLPLPRILVVEDEPLIHAMAKLALEKVGGFNVLVCASGALALAQVAEFAPDLILLDVVMPDMDGPATLRQLRLKPESAAIPVCFLTANAQVDDVARYKALGAIGVIAKPFNPMTLAAQVRQVWDAPVA